MERVVVTGMGVVSPLGNTLESFEENLFAGMNGVGPITRFDSSKHNVHLAAEVKNLDINAYIAPKEQRRMDRFAILAMVASAHALDQSGLLKDMDPNRTGVIIGSGIGGIQTWEDQHTRLLEKGPRQISPFFVPMMIVDIAAGRVSIKYGLKGPNYGIVSACATASHSIGDACRLIQVGDADAMVAGGSEAPVTPISIAGFSSMKAMTRNPDPASASRPFDAGRDGFVIGEGAGILVLESLEHARKRGAQILGEIAGYGATADAYHITAPAEGGEGAVRAMNFAMQNGGVTPAEVGYINAHGTSTPYNDKNETIAIKTVFGEHVRNLVVSSTKSMTGHLLGASGGIEAIGTLLALQRQETPPTINYITADPDCDLNYSPNAKTPHSFDYALSNTFGFGGHNAVLMMKRYAA